MTGLSLGLPRIMVPSKLLILTAGEQRFDLRSQSLPSGTLSSHRHAECVCNVDVRQAVQTQLRGRKHHPPPFPRAHPFGASSGAPDRASTIELTGISDNTGIAEARIRKARSNETLRLRFNHGGGGSISAGDHIVASWEVNDGEFVLNGFEFLENNIAWSTLRNVLRDEHLNEAIVSFVNSEMSQASGDDVHSGCAELCGMDYPTPDDCNGAIDSYLCCINEAQKDYCRRNCVCAAKYSEWWQAVQGGVCRKAANSAVMIDLIACTPSFIL